MILPVHKVKKIQELLESAGAKVIYLSPYSPDFNPIENCWCGSHCRFPVDFKSRQGRQSKIKEYLRAIAARSREVLEEAITDAINLVSLQDIKNWFIHCCYCTSSD
ncbi:transposase [Chroococcus sp. FPU101]|uniref:transposase n=1 Tax=Chroococcus sp. FPU101 TaxID=1974212 RepID=UPI001A8C5F0B|nr:transposase [Chroococcus sp. FPU101]GFE71918.1 hypothetical protein CFPU101_45280 [Chroococcus sp. FPU101]